ncbi:MAG: DUF4159 domain-containing protein [Candidatus Latescibacterota bacterium]
MEFVQLIRLILLLSAAVLLILAIFVRLHRALLITLAVSCTLHYTSVEIAELLIGRGAAEEMHHIRFVAPPPIMKKSFDLAKRPEISEVQMEYLSSMAQPPAIREDLSSLSDISSLGADLLGAVSPTMQDFVGSYSGAKPAEMVFETAEMVSLTEVATPVQEAVNLETELLSMGDLDTGRYKAIIVQDPDNKRNLKGFFNMTLVKYNFQDINRDTYPMAIPNLIQYLNDYTNLRARIDGQKIELSDRGLVGAPFIYMTGFDAVVSLSETEIQNLGEYLRSGGFLFVEDIAPNVDTDGKLGGDLPNAQRGLKGTAFDQQMRSVLKQALGSEAKFQRILKSHDVFHAFYDFDDGPPLGGSTGGNVEDLEGIYIRGRLAVVFSDLNISWYWGEKNVSGRERGLQFGVNLIAYALTQPGGIANISEYTSD